MGIIGSTLRTKENLLCSRRNLSHGYQPVGISPRPNLSVNPSDHDPQQQHLTAGFQTLHSMSTQDHIQRESPVCCKYCPHCQVNSLSMRKVKQVLKPYFEHIVEEAEDMHLPSHILNITSIPDYYTREGLEGDDHRFLDTAIELLLTKKIELPKLIDHETLKKLESIDISNAMSFFKRKDIDSLLERTKKVMGRSKDVREELRKSQGLETASEAPGIFAKVKRRLQVRPPAEDEVYPVAIFACIQELIREFTLSSKDRGGLMLKALYSFFDENESRWLKLIETLLDTIDCLGKEQEALLRSIRLRKADIDTLLHRIEPTQENLTAHKFMIRDLLASVHQERAKRINLGAQHEMLKRELGLWLVHWEDLRVSKRITGKLEQLPESVIQDTFLLKKEYDSMC